MPTYLDSSADLLTALEGASNGESFQCAAAATYTVNGTINVTADNVSIDLTGSTVYLFPDPSATSDIVVTGANFEFHNGIIARGVVVFRLWGDSAHIHHLTTLDANQAVGTGINTLVLADIFHSNQGTNATIDHITAGVCNSVCIYSNQNNTQISYSTFAGSWGEDVIRWDTPSGSTTQPTGGLVDHCTVSNLCNHYQKEAISFRRGSGTVQYSTINGYVRAGESTASVIGEFAAIDYNCVQFPTLIYQTIGGENQISIKQGVTATVRNCSLASDLNQANVGVDLYSAVVFANNYRVRPAVGASVNSYLWHPSPNTNVTESGTTIVDPGTPLPTAPSPLPTPPTPPTLRHQTLDRTPLHMPVPSH